ncbi:MAG: UvrD-helicase domain-containing protein [Planctomycetes bacterium]|nr:UvrD-helicase domain-containing protein [Planctomycetota bacterium]
MTADPLADLTDAQREAVLHVKGPMLVVAGPGSGKTRVITRRIARLIEGGVAPESILAITFTNKAAHEMARRVHELCSAQGAWIRTFHSTCAAILRRWPESAGLRHGFTIYDSDEQAKIVRASLRELDIASAALKPSEALQAISRWKADGLTPEEVLAKEAYTYERRYKAQVFEKYVKQLRENNAVDFDDLLSLVRRALDTDEHVRQALQGRFEHVLIDEYQDTSPVQFHLARLLAARTGNLCATGDPDQSIYAFRKADLRNILDFEQHYPGAKVVRLEHNFRSVATVLKAADALIAKNRERRVKKLIPTRETGALIRVVSSWTEREEAQNVADAILETYSKGTPYRDIAIFYRVNSQSRALELALRSKGIPYTIVKGVEFFQRAEVKDVLAYLKVIANPSDREAMERVVSTPSRGIGKVSIERMQALAKERGWSSREALRKVADHGEVPARAVAAMRGVAEVLDAVERSAVGSVAALMEEVLRLTQFEKYMKEAYDEEYEDRWSNVLELVQSAREYDQEHGAESSVVGYLMQVGLVADTDAYDPDAPRVPLMTLHSAKGLEFREVFLTGLEEGLLPHSRSVDDAAALEEERRLLFVGITRAKDRLMLSYATDRSVRIPGTQIGRSRFLDELPPEVLDINRDTGPASVPRGLGGDWKTYDDGDGASSHRGDFSGGDDDLDEPPTRSTSSARSTTSGAPPWGTRPATSGTSGGAPRAAPGPRPGGGSFGSGRPSGAPGADFQPDYSSDDDPSSRMRVNGAVHHAVFGRGNVVRLIGHGPSARAVVRFFGVGEKTLSLAHAKLTILD